MTPERGAHPGWRVIQMQRLFLKTVSVRLQTCIVYDDCLPHTDESVLQLNYTEQGTMFTQTLYSSQVTAVHIRYATLFGRVLASMTSDTGKTLGKTLLGCVHQRVTLFECSLI